MCTNAGLNQIHHLTERLLQQKLTESVGLKPVRPGFRFRCFNRDFYTGEIGKTFLFLIQQCLIGFHVTHFIGFTRSRYTNMYRNISDGGDG